MRAEAVFEAAEAVMGVGAVDGHGDGFVVADEDDEALAAGDSGVVL